MCGFLVEADLDLPMMNPPDGVCGTVQCQWALVLQKGWRRSCSAEPGLQVESNKTKTMPKVGVG